MVTSSESKFKSGTNNKKPELDSQNWDFRKLRT